jgi:hypothetical protein
MRVAVGQWLLFAYMAVRGWCLTLPSDGSLENPTSLLPFPLLQGGLPVMTTLMNGTITPSWCRHLSCFRRFPNLIPCRITPKSPSFNCSLFRVAQTTHYFPLRDVPPLVCFHKLACLHRRWSPAIVTDTSLEGWPIVLNLGTPALQMALEPGPARLSTDSRESSRSSVMNTIASCYKLTVALHTGWRMWSLSRMP